MVEGEDALAKQADILACQRLDFIAKTVYQLFHHKGFEVSAVAEKLQPKNMVKNRYLAKSIADAAWSMFFEWCNWVAKRDGKHFHQVPPQQTSQTCSECCQKSDAKLELSQRTFHCKSCGLELDRDHNAALNVLFKAACALRGEVWDAILYPFTFLFKHNLYFRFQHPAIICSENEYDLWFLWKLIANLLTHPVCKVSFVQQYHQEE